MLRQFIALVVTVAAAYVYFRYFNAQLGWVGYGLILLASQLIGRVSSRLIVEALYTVHEAAHYAAYVHLSGKHYAFDNHALRFYLSDDTIWISADDVIPILQPPPEGRELRLLGKEYGDIPGQGIKGISEAGLMRLVTTRTTHRRVTRDAVRFKSWLEDEALPNLKRLPSSFTAQVTTTSKKSGDAA